jgi:hypothetical protein
VAVTVTDPAPVTVRVLPLNDAGPVTLNAIGNPLEELALRVNGETPKVLFGRAPKVTVWEDFATVKVRATGVAPR